MMPERGRTDNPAVRLGGGSEANGRGCPPRGAQSPAGIAAVFQGGTARPSPRSLCKALGRVAVAGPDEQTVGEWRAETPGSSRPERNAGGRAHRSAAGRGCAGAPTAVPSEGSADAGVAPKPADIHGETPGTAHVRCGQAQRR